MKEIGRSDPMSITILPASRAGLATITEALFPGSRSRSCQQEKRLPPTRILPERGAECRNTEAMHEAPGMQHTGMTAQSHTE
jgi:hypothetical protein